MEKFVLVLSKNAGLGYTTYYKTFFDSSKASALEEFSLCLKNKLKEKELVDKSNRIFYKEIDILQQILYTKKEIENKSALEKKIESIYQKLNKFDSNMTFKDLVIDFSDCLDEDDFLFEPKILTLDEWFESRR